MRTGLGFVASVALVAGAWGGRVAARPADQEHTLVIRVSGAITLDPTQDNESVVLQRDDVRHALMLTGDQQVRLNRLLSASARARESALQAGFAQTRKQASSDAAQQADQQGTLMQQRMQYMRALTSRLDRERQAEIEAVLIPGQVTRARQVELQWRTPMAAADPSVASKLGLSQQQKLEIAGVLAEFRREQQKARSAILSIPAADGGAASHTSPPMATQEPLPPGPLPPNQTTHGSFSVGLGMADGQLELTESSDGPDPPSPPPGMEPEAIRQRARAAELAMEQARAKYGGEALAVLTPVQRAQWERLTGRPFYFVPLD